MIKTSAIKPPLFFRAENNGIFKRFYSLTPSIIPPILSIMKSSRAGLLLLSSLVFIPSFVFGAAVAVGSGSYTDTLPSGQTEMQSTIYKTSNLTGPIPTSDWWSFILLNGAGDSISAFPLTLRCQNDGLNIFLPQRIVASADTFQYGPDEVWDLELKGLVGGAPITAASVNVDKFSDWTVTPQWKSGTDYFDATFGHGLPFVYAQYYGNAQPAVVLLSVNAGANRYFTEAGVISGQPFATVFTTVTDHIGLMTNVAGMNNYYGLFAAAGSTWTITESSVTVTMATGSDYFSVAIVTTTVVTQGVGPISESELAAYYQHAYAFITNTQVSWNVDMTKSQITTTFNATVQSMQNSETVPYMFVFPHQWKNSTYPFVAGQTFSTLRGTMKLVDSNTFTVVNNFNGILPDLPYRPDGSYSNTHLAALLAADKLTAFYAESSGNWSSYTHGKELGRLSCLIPIANQLGDATTRTYLLNRLKTDLIAWYTYTPGETQRCFYYNSNWGSMIAYNADFYEQNFTDQHFHFGYFVYASGILGLYDRDFINGYGGMVEMLIRSFACPNRSDTKFPFLRNLDPYEGHSWADSGYDTVTHTYKERGNDEESSSEAMNGWAGIYLWGLATGNTTYRDLGIYGYTTEYSGIREYWLDIDNTQYSAPYNHDMASQIWDTQALYNTFFDIGNPTIDPIYRHGIQWFPITPSMLYLGYEPTYAQSNYNQMVSEAGSITTWYDVVWKFQSLFDPASALTAYNESITPDPGNSLTLTYYWLHDFDNMGKVDTSVYANVPSYNVFNKSGTKLYVAFNPSDTPLTANFYNRSDNSIIGTVQVSSHTTVSTTDFATFKTEYVPVTGTLTGSSTTVGSSTATVVSSTAAVSNVYSFGTWTAEIDIPAGAFSEDVVMTVSSASVPAGQNTIKLSNICVDITLDPAIQPSKDITVTLAYSDSDVVGFDTSRLVIAYYDALHSRWITIPSVPYPSLRKVTGTVAHLSRFAIAQLVPASGLDAVKAYPMPYDPANGSLVIDNLTSSADIRIYDIAGELIRKAPYSSGNGRASWDGKNDAGSIVASGIYLMYIESPEGKKRLKIAVER